MNGNSPNYAPPLVSILIVNYNGADFLSDCLNSLRELAYPRCEVIVVDNASTDSSSRILAMFPFVKVVRSERNLGFAGGNNLGLQHSLGELVLLLNSDTIVNQDFLTVLSRYLEAHPHVGVVQGKMRLTRRNGLLDACGSFLTWNGFPYHYGYLKPDDPKYQCSYPIFCAKGACLMFRREIIARIGGYLFDENFFCYYEESDFCHRAWLAGYETHFVPGPPIQHLMGATAARTQKASFVLRHYLRNMTFSLLSNLSPTSLLTIMPFYFTVLLASMAVSVVTFRWPQALAHGQALIYCLRNLKGILAQRRRIKSIRKKKDPEIFTKVMRSPRLDYFLKTFTGRLSEYVDEA